MVCLACHEADGRGTYRPQDDERRRADPGSHRPQVAGLPNRRRLGTFDPGRQREDHAGQEGHPEAGPHRHQGDGRFHAKFPGREAGRHRYTGRSTSPGSTGPGCRGFRSLCTGLIRVRSSDADSSADSPRGRTEPANLHDTISTATGIDEPGATGDRFWPVSRRFGVSRLRNVSSGTGANHAWPWHLLADSATHLHRAVARTGCEVAGRIGVLPDQLLRLPRNRRNRECDPAPHARHSRLHQPAMADQSKQQPVADQRPRGQRGKYARLDGKIHRGVCQGRDLLCRSFGPPDLLAAETSTGTFQVQFRQLQQQWEELEKQVKLFSSH